MPITNTAIPRSEPCAVDDAFAMAIDAEGPIPTAAIIKPAKVSVGDEAQITSNTTDEIATNVFITNLRTGIQYKWDGVQWLKSFEGEYLPGSWRLTLNP
jgi:hypothetical protein